MIRHRQDKRIYATTGYNAEGHISRCSGGLGEDDWEYLRRRWHWYKRWRCVCGTGV